MKILAFSDLHRSKKAALAILNASADADVVVGAGDFATQGRGLFDTTEILRRVTVPLVVVPGNHERFDDLEAAFAGLTNVYVLHGTMATIKGLRFFGMGYEVHDEPDQPWNQRVSEMEATDLLDCTPEDVILVTHNPPYGVADIQSDGTHEVT